MLITMDSWNMIVIEALEPSVQGLHSLTNEDIADIIRRSKEEQEKTKNNLIEGIVNRTEIADKREWIQINQSFLIRSLDKLHVFRHSKKWPESINELYSTVMQHFQNTLDFIEDFFGNYFDRNKKVPMPYLLISLEELCRQLNAMKNQLRSQPIDKELGEIICNNFSKFCLQKNKSVTYNDLRYQKDLMNELLVEGALDSQDSLIEILFYFNFNDDSFIDYLYRNLKSEIEPLSINERISKLRFKQKSFNQLAAKFNCSLSTHIPSLKKQVNHWIDEEIKFLESNLNEGAETSTNNSGLFIQIPFRGSEIYLLHKAFIDAGGAPAESYKSLLQKTSSRLSNKNQKGFSPESLKKASDKVDPEARENVKRFLQRMIRNIDSYD
jgi:hypothetical protein